MEEYYKLDCPKCYGQGSYTMTNCEDERPIRCTCDFYQGKEWELVKKECDIDLSPEILQKDTIINLLKE